MRCWRIGAGAGRIGAADSPPRTGDPVALRLHNTKRHLLAFDLKFDRLSIIGAFDGECEQASGHLIAPGIEHRDERRGIGLPGQVDAILDFEAGFLAGENDMIIIIAKP